MMKRFLFYFILLLFFNPSTAQISWDFCQDTVTIHHKHTYYKKNNLLKHFKPDRFIKVAICSDSSSSLTYEDNNSTHLIFNYELFILDSNLNKVKPYSEFGHKLIQFSEKEFQKQIKQIENRKSNSIKKMSHRIILKLYVRFYSLGNWYCTNLKPDSKYFIVLNQIIKKEEGNQIQRSDTATLIVK